MVCLEIGWKSVFWTLLFSIVSINPLVEARNVVHLNFDWRESPPGVVQNELPRRPQARSYIQEGMYNNRSLLAYGSYMANVTVGTPGQSISLVIENGWSETIVLAATAYECNQKSWPDGDGPCYGGTFDPSKSSTFSTTVPNGLSASQGSGNPDESIVTFVGDYFTDSFGIGGVQLKSLDMGLALDFANSTTYYGVLGLGRPGPYEPVAMPYPTFMDQLVSQSLINIKAYSIYMNDLNSTEGSIVFGGIDTSKFSGTLGVLPSTNDLVDMTRIAILDSQGKTWVMLNTTEAVETNLTTSFGVSNLLSWVSYSTLNNFISYFGGVDDRNNTGVVFVDCEKLTTEAGASFEFTFGRPAGPTITVPMSEMILPLSCLFSPQAAALVKTPFTNTCVLGITSWNESTSAESPSLNIFTLGNTFLRSAYIVFDYDHNQTALAQGVYGIADSNIVELSASATGIPTLSGTVASSTSTPGSGSTFGGGTSGSGGKSSGISGGAIAGIVVGVLIVLGAIGFVAFLGVRRQRTIRREPETEDPTRKPRNRIQEVPGKDHEIQKEALLSQDNKLDQTSKSDTYVATNKGFIVEENELPTQHNKLELPENEVQIRATGDPRELETQVQHNELELLGSSEHPVEAPSATYSPVHAELDPYGAISPDQLKIAHVPELPADPIQQKPLPTQSSVPRFSGTSLPESLPASSAAGPADHADTRSASTGPSKVDILQERLERVRAEKDRLSKLQQLEEMEAALQQEVMAELKKERVADGRGSGGLSVIGSS